MKTCEFDNKTCNEFDPYLNFCYITGEFHNELKSVEDFNSKNFMNFLPSASANIETQTRKSFYFLIKSFSNQHC